MHDEKNIVFKKWRQDMSKKLSRIMLEKYNKLNIGYIAQLYL